MAPIAVAADGELFFSNDADQRVYRARRGEVPQPVTAPGARRFADRDVDPRAEPADRGPRGPHGGAAQPNRSTRSSRSTSRAAPRRYSPTGHDFFSSPRLSRDGRRLAWLSVGPSAHAVAGQRALGRRARRRRRAGARRARSRAAPSESVCQPAGRPAASCYFVSDRSGWWNLYRQRDGNGSKPLHADDGRVRRAALVVRPGDVRLPARRHASSASFERDGRSQLGADRADGALTPSSRRPSARSASLRVGPASSPASRLSETAVQAVVRLDLATGDAVTLRRASEIASRRRRRLGGRGDRVSPAAAARARTRSTTRHATARSTGRRRAAAAARRQPRRPDRLRPTRRCAAGVPVLDQPRLCRRSTSTTAARPATAAPTASASTASGAIVDVDDVVAARALPGRARRCRRRSRSRSAAAAPAATRRSRALTFRDFFHAGASHLRRQRSRGARARHAQVRVALSRLADRPVARARRRSTARARRSTSPIA